MVQELLRGLCVCSACVLKINNEELFFNEFLFENSYYFSSIAPYIRVIKPAQRRYTKINVVAEL